jgi:polysaccharide pyruvyl transferase WcaK-like protein
MRALIAGPIKETLYAGARLAARAGREPVAVVVGIAHPGSIGDEAMVSVLVRRRARAGRVLIASLELPWPELRWCKGLPIDTMIYPRPDLGGARSLLSLARLCGAGGTFDVVGADIIDGTYSPTLARSLLDAVGVVARAGATATVMGCSINKLHPRVAQAMRRLPPSARVCVRDPVSLGRLEATCPQGGQRIGTADLAFLTEPAPALPGGLPAQLAAARAAGRPLLGINLNPHQVPDAANFCKALVARLREVVPGIFVLGVGHDTRLKDGADDWTPFAGSGCDAVVPRDIEAPEVRLLADSLDAVVTARLHFAILSAAAGTPAVGLAYVGKFEGFFRHLGLDPARLLDARKPDVEATAAESARVLRERAALSATIRAHLPAVLAASERNFPEGTP